MKSKLTETEKQKKTEALAGELFQLARDSVFVHLRFLDVALSGLKPKADVTIQSAAMDGKNLYYNPVYILKKYSEDNHYVVRLLLHMLFHCIFYHTFQYSKMEGSCWNLAADIAVENAVLDMKLAFANLERDEEAREKLLELKEKAGGITAEKIYRYFRKNPPSEKEAEELRRLFMLDDHMLWKEQEVLLVTEEQWKKISERMKADLKSFSKNKTGSEGLEKNLEEATKDRYDYGDILKRFTVMGEDIQLNQDEFDYIYYTYGLAAYGNMPLIEPLEYNEVQKIKDFIIALDTSASCRGPVVQAFLKKTYSILKSTENFFHKINVHIIQCDNQVQSDTKITNEDDFNYFIENGKLTGFGSTDFRPVFEYVDELLRQGEFDNLKGLIYFTDGYGIYPERMPEYDVIFAFLEDDERKPQVPPWAIQVVLDRDQMEEEINGGSRE